MWYSRPDARAWRCKSPPSDPEAFHRSMPGYQRTPLVDFPQLAREVRVGRVLVKDESWRLQLPAFKILGASWAVCRALSERDTSTRIAKTLNELSALRSRSGHLTLVTATDGNHGRAVARMARLVGADAHVFLPEVADTATVAAIDGEGAKVTVVEDNYDETVRCAARSADDAETLLVQDTAWPGYEQVPQWIVDGYSTAFREITDQVRALGIAPVGLMVVPTGVGSLAQAAVVANRSSASPGPPAAILAVEPESAACVASSLRLGRPVTVPTGTTNMAGLSCGTPSSIAWPILSRGLDAAITVFDEQSDLAARDLARGGVRSGPSGAASLAGLRSALGEIGGDRRREQLGLTSDSTVVLLSTEGAAGGAPAS